MRETSITDERHHAFKKKRRVALKILSNEQLLNSYFFWHDISIVHCKRDSINFRELVPFCRPKALLTTLRDGLGGKLPDLPVLPPLSADTTTSTATTVSTTTTAAAVVEITTDDSADIQPTPIATETPGNTGNIQLSNGGRDHHHYGRRRDAQ